MRQHVRRGAIAFSRAEDEEGFEDPPMCNEGVALFKGAACDALEEADEVDTRFEQEAVEEKEEEPTGSRPLTGLAIQLLTGLECGEACCLALGLLLGVEEGVEIGGGPSDGEYKGVGVDGDGALAWYWEVLEGNVGDRSLT
ncbi:hypothetical protein EST38_g9198 [Candolleomyces aberdarensis]|uniref:Uncharacterized protein n=1 Tax=Candolleomyces aberdarensis TaxID=2316362 RepID=A0A4Q2DDG9_9AGAR|nr:hypothetical protein EST38_g9198 [Candolleomyces aberdarensis]